MIVRACAQLQATTAPCRECKSLLLKRL